ncbi:hypothetical protein [Oricola cellulosilytica]|uniref:Uncharacterized protein n=1 Tax=Oricola cellulosilytica TaxID=1429082 RepID=A0A4R0P965_9HYPH|nr:hypothetical protein [Oricola cellulosilytica]TCD11287.1 hypothetical protein E0D97_17325 [Oricola cellulosilytica]
MVIISHLLAVIFGVGGALILDIYLLRHIRGRVIRGQDVEFVNFMSALVKTGLIAIWATGIIILSIAPDGPASVLSNPKVQAKLVIVVVLTLNSLFIETVALPLIRNNVKHPLFHNVSSFQQTAILSFGAISTVSWMTPFVLGLTPELNTVVPAHVILGVYATLVGATALATQFLVSFMYRPRSSQRPARRQTARPSKRQELLKGDAPVHAAMHEAIEKAYARPGRKAARK